MRRLTVSEEIQLLRQAIKADHYLGSGSSRAVFSLGDGSGTVIKVALDRGGYIQNKHEAVVSEEFPYYCATVHAIGKYILVMDYIEIHDYYEGWLERMEDDGDDSVGSLRDNYNRDKCSELRFQKKSFDEDYDYFADKLVEDDCDYDTLEKMLTFMRDARDDLGVGGDCYQIGFDPEGNFKLYDFGFVQPNLTDDKCFDMDYDKQIGCIENFSDGLENYTQLCEIAIGRLISRNRRSN